jgi:hypothetical protein
MRLRFSNLSGKPKARSANGRDCAQKKYKRIAPRPKRLFKRSKNLVHSVIIERS